MKNLRNIRNALPWLSGLILIFAMIAFEMFNFSSTEYALHDLLGNISFAGLEWATILALAFCGVDFAGIARIFTAERGRNEPQEVKLLLIAWLIASIFNAGLTWWGVSQQIVARGVSHPVLPQSLLVWVVPVAIALIVLILRIVLINTFTFTFEASRRVHKVMPTTR